jgi:tetratricopeptide (TPR) repeat protein
MRADDARWTPTMAGFVTVRLVDKWSEALHGWLAPRPSEIAAVRDAIEKVSVGPIRNVLTSIVDAVTQSWGKPRSAVSARVLAYAALLYDEESWALASDVYRTFLSFAETAADRDLGAHAWVRLGTSLVMDGQLTDGQAAHEAGRAMAASAGQRYLELLAEHGLAIVALQRGNLPDADARLGTLAVTSHAEMPADPSITDILARALHDRGWVAMQRGEVDRAVGLFYDAIQYAPDSRRKDRVLQDLALAFAELGNRKTACKVMRMIEERSEERRVRWLAALNLMRYAVLDGSETVFEGYRRSLVSEPLPPRLMVYYYMYVGDGCRRFDREPQAVAAYSRAITIAERHSLNQLVIEAEEAKNAKPIPAEKEAEARPMWSPEAERVARAIDEMVGAGA